MDIDFTWELQILMRFKILQFNFLSEAIEKPTPP